MKKCALCKKEILDEKFAPFCSSRCRNIDLGKWLNGSYVIPGDNLEKKMGKSDLPSGHKNEIVYDLSKSPDSSVGRAED